MPEASWAKIIVRWYESESLVWSGIGAWAKFTYEFTVAAVPLAPLFFVLGLLVPAITFASPPAAGSAITQWLSLSLGITGIRWCFTAAGISTDDD